ncbi:acyltransferase domain-containing protein, partial [Actinomadura latina]|uniref:acyltransferase domain-containing protein n=1 Tax=Actinomadura latina TaxID=163603 RepID=UPI0024805A54
MFPGQGSQWLGMGRELAGCCDEFGRELAVVAGEVDRWWGHRLLEVMWGSEEGVLGRTEFAQPVLFAVGVALFRVLVSWGVVPDFVVGHSVGEIAAACAAGMVSLEDAARLVVARGRVMQRADAGGAMVAVSGPVVSVELVEQVLGEVSGSLGPVVVAAVNAPTVVVISGARAAVEAAAARLSAVGCGTRSLSVSHAFHSPLLDPVLEDFRQVAAGVGVCAGEVGLVSNVSGGLADVGEGFGSAEYWVRHARQAVRFADAIGFAAARGADRFVELGPGALVSAISATVDSGASSVVSLLSRRGSERVGLVSGLAELFVSGVGVSWQDWC